MKIRTKRITVEELEKKQRPKHFTPKKPNMFFRTLIKVLSYSEMRSANFKYTEKNMDKAGKGPWLILMNHSSFVDFKIAHSILYPKPFCVVATTDAFVSKAWLMRQIGCIPTQKFVADVTLLKDMEYSIKKLNTSVLMYPEAGYSFDGRATSLPAGLGRLLKVLDVPVVNIQTFGAFLREPLYNCLQKRDVDVSAEISCLLSREEIREKTADELNAILNGAYTFDSFKWQKDNGINIDEPFRADGLNRILFKCPHCMTEGKMEGKGRHLTCKACSKVYELKEDGSIEATDGESAFRHIPDWYDWEKECVKNELADGSYKLDVEVDICALVDYKALYRLGDGRLVHTSEGFRLTSDDGKISYTQKPLVSHCLNSDYYWYEIGDIISIGNRDTLYYCFPKGEVDVVAKTRIAVEEIYKKVRGGRRTRTPDADKTNAQ